MKNACVGFFYFRIAPVPVPPQAVPGQRMPQQVPPPKELLEQNPAEAEGAGKDVQETHSARDDRIEFFKTSSPFVIQPGEQTAECVVVQLLRAMGYGAIGGRGLVKPKSRDGGIDGVIYEDKLGLGNVCVQAKRWDGTVTKRYETDDGET